ncbi:Spherulation-specific family 4-domain-containing protein [Xylariaceae sp. FL0016]|nr:Spherulation-specific family 4-domain-containing protein [Xylariaceae sp. FL0016]
MKVLLPLALVSLVYATDLLVPLYPPPSEWGPVETAVKNNPSVTAKIIINPSNGPTASPSDDFRAGTQALSSNANAQLIGYVHTGVVTNGVVVPCERPVDDVKADIRTWSSWVTNEIIIHGIFIDEAPVDASNNCTAYMQDLTAFIKGDPSLKFASPRIVVFNPGQPGVGGLKAYYAQDPAPDLIVALENCFTTPDKALGFDTTGDDCPPTGGYAIYDKDGYGSSIDTYLSVDVGVDNYPKTAIIVHGFHDTNGNITASSATLLEEIRTVKQKGIGAVFFNTFAYFQFGTPPADIGSVAADLAAVN